MEVDILKKILERRLEDEAKGVDSEINITEKMKQLIEKNRSDLFHSTIPFNFHLLSWWENGTHKTLFIREAKVVGRNRIFIPTNAKIRGRASFIVCQYAKMIEDKVSGCVEIEALPVTRMVGWQFKGKALPHNRGVILLVDEVYCAISGKKLQETSERYKEKLIKSIVKFFYEISGPVALRIANQALKERGVVVGGDFSIKGEVENVDYKELVDILVDSYAQIFGERLSRNIPKLLESISESLRSAPVQKWMARPIKSRGVHEREEEELIIDIVKFFYEISGPVALRIANEVLEKSGMFMQRDFTIKYRTESPVNYEEIISRLIKRYAKIFGERLAGRARRRDDMKGTYR